jgi:hypothetical protein
MAREAASIRVGESLSINKKNVRFGSNLSDAH